MEEPLVSVIIPVYNMERYLERCLDSVLNNTYRNLEVICIDDGSKDSSLEILRRYEAADPRIVVITKENGGVSSARNAGLDRMTGEYVTFIDSDDFVHPQYIEIMVYAITKTNSDLVITEPTRVFPEDLPMEMKKISVSSIEIKTATRVQVYRTKELRSYCVCKLVRKTSIASSRFLLNFKYGEDILFFADIWERNPDLKCDVFSQSLYYYYQGNPNSAVANSDEHEMLKATRYSVCRCALSRENEQIYLYMAISQLVWYRYYGAEIRGDRTVRRECDLLLRSCWKRMICSPDYSGREKLVLSVKMLLPALDLLYRRRKPAFRAWEQAERQKYNR